MTWLRRLLARWFPSSDRVSEAWLKEHASDGRVEYHGVAMNFPVKKLLNESVIWNKYRMERGA